MFGMERSIHDNCEMDDENDRLNLQERNAIEISRSSSGYLSEQGNGQSVESDDVEHSCKADMLRRQLDCLTTNGSTNTDGSGHLLDSESNTTMQELNSVSDPAAVHEASNGGEFDSTFSVKCPSPPSKSPGFAVTSTENCDGVSAVLSNVVDTVSSNTSHNSYIWSSASSELPSWYLEDNEEKLIWPEKDPFFSATDRFEEDIHYRLLVEIASGAFGCCYYAVEVPADGNIEGRGFCAKTCKYRKNELLALELAKKENIAEIVDFYGAKIKGKHVTIFMEYMSGGTIKDLIEKIKECGSANWPTLSEANSLVFLEDVLKAVNFLHCKGIVHKDIKGANVLLDENGRHAKLTDFGSAESRENASLSIDIWKIACLLLEMLNGERPSRLFLDEGSLQRQNACRLEDFIPSNAREVTKELLCFFNSLPSAAAVLKYFPVTE